MRIRTQTGNDVTITNRANDRIAIEQSRSYILLNRRELRELIDALTEFATDYQPRPRIQRFVAGVEQF